MKRLILILSVGFLAGCGGGGGSDGGEDVSKYAGGMRIVANLVENTCGLNRDSLIDSVVQVNTNPPVVVVDAPNGIKYSGTGSNEGFVATATLSGQCNSGVPATNNLTLNIIDFNTGTITVNFSEEASCQGSRVKCVVTYVGEATLL